MKATHENTKKWTKYFVFVIGLISASQIFVACNKGGDSNATPVPVVPPPPPSVACFGINCGTSSANMLASALGRNTVGTTYEIQIQILAPGPIATTAPGQSLGMGAVPYSGPVQINGVINVTQAAGYICSPPVGVYNFTSSAGSVYFDATNRALQGTVTAGPLSVTFGSVNSPYAFLSPAVPAAVSANGQSFPFILYNAVTIQGGGMMPGYAGGPPQPCGINEPDFLPIFQ